jgi:hypothetical protein
MQKSFKSYHESNPKIYEKFQKIACVFISKGERRIESEMICNIIKYELITNFDDAYKIIKDFHSNYAKKFEADFPNHAGVFTKRLVNFELDD